MLDLKAIRHDASAVVASLAKRGLTFDLARFESLDARRKAADVRSQSLLAERKSTSDASSPTWSTTDNVSSRSAASFIS